MTESDSASEQMNGQAEQIKEVVKELTYMLGGNRDEVVSSRHGENKEQKMDGRNSGAEIRTRSLAIPDQT